MNISMPTTDRLRELFNQQIHKFSNDMRLILSDDTDAIGYLDALDGIMSVSPSIVSAFYREHIGDPYHDMIMKKDEKFLTGDVMDRFGSGPFGALCNEIYQKWTDLSERERDIIWDYFKVLTKISQKIHT